MATKFETLWAMPAHVADPRVAVTQAFAALQWVVKEQNANVIVAAVSASAGSFGEKCSVSVSADRTVQVRSECRGSFQVVDWGKNKTNVYAFLAALEKVCAAGADVASPAQVPQVPQAFSSGGSSAPPLTSPVMAQQHAAAEAKQNRTVMLAFIGVAVLAAANQGWRWLEGPAARPAAFQLPLRPAARVTRFSRRRFRSLLTPPSPRRNAKASLKL